MFDTIAIGNVTEDIILNLKKNGQIIKTRTFGGASTYSSFCLRNLNARVGIVSKISKDFPHLKKFDGIDLTGLKFAEETTTFELTYDEREDYYKPREIKILKDAGKIEIKGVPKEYYNTKSVIFGPIFSEIKPQMISKFDGVVKAIDLQGLLRKRNENSRVKNCVLENLDEFLSVDIVKIGEDELKVLGNSCTKVSESLAPYSPEAILITFGERGSLVYNPSTLLWNRIPAFKTRAVDETGSGDVYLSSFLYQYMKTNDVIESSCFASAAASFVVEAPGPEKFGSLDEIEERMKRIRREIR